MIFADIGFNWLNYIYAMYISLLIQATFIQTFPVKSTCIKKESIVVGTKPFFGLVD